ncbi:MAG: hypothetical protein ACLFQY_10920, partial [Desulfococcaceae bacterium]
NDFGSRQSIRILSGENFAARPKPRPEPVITAVCPFKLIFSSFLSSKNGWNPLMDASGRSLKVIMIYF